MLNLDIVCVTETWFDAAPAANIFLGSNYIIAAFSYRSTGEHGGTLILCKKSCAYITVPTGVVFISCVFLINFQTVVLCVYNPPIGSHYRITSQNLISAVSDFLRIYRDMKMVICGDFNMPDVDWDLLIAQGQDSSAIIDHFMDLDLQQIVCSSTHARANILNLIFTNLVNFNLEGQLI